MTKIEQLKIEPPRIEDLTCTESYVRELKRELADKSESLAFQTQLNREAIKREKQTFAELATERALADMCSPRRGSVGHSSPTPHQ